MDFLGEYVSSYYFLILDQNIIIGSCTYVRDIINIVATVSLEGIRNTKIATLQSNVSLPLIYLSWNLPFNHTFCLKCLNIRNFSRVTTPFESGRYIPVPRDILW